MDGAMDGEATTVVTTTDVMKDGEALADTTEVTITDVMEDGVVLVDITVETTTDVMEDGVALVDTTVETTTKKFSVLHSNKFFIAKIIKIIFISIFYLLSNINNN
jgi:predicted peptidase